MSFNWLLHEQSSLFYKIHCFLASLLDVAAWKEELSRLQFTYQKKTCGQALITDHVENILLNRKFLLRTFVANRIKLR